MITKLGFDDFDVLCDMCGRNLMNTGDTSFFGSVEEAKNQGWLIRKEMGEWYHICDICRQEKETYDKELE